MKQESKPTRKQKIADGKKPEAKKAKVVAVKEKGPAPESYAPNNQHKVEVERQVFAKKIADARPKNEDLVSGKTGNYLTGYTEDNYTEGHYFDVVTKDVPGNAGKNDYTLTLINGDVQADDGGEPVSIPHSWLFKDIERIKFAAGRIGEIQRDMLVFLQRVMAPEIADEKLCRIEDAKAAKKAAQAAAALENPGRGALFTLATSGGNPVNPGPLKLCSLSNFGPQRYARYNFTGKKNTHCLVEYTKIDGIDALRINGIHADHPLAQAGVKTGLVMHAKHLNRECAIPSPEAGGLHVEVYAHLVLLRGFLIQALNEMEERKAIKAA